MERDQLRAVSTLVVTVKSPDEFHDDVTDGLESLEHGDSVDTTPTLSFTSYDDFMDTLPPRTLELLKAVRQEAPSSINETARVVDRDATNVHEELSRLAQLGIIFFEEVGQSRRPVVWFDKLVITLSFETGTGDTAAAAP
jgi:predicted transcriptional regulator